MHRIELYAASATLCGAAVITSLIPLGVRTLVAHAANGQSQPTMAVGLLSLAVIGAALFGGSTYVILQRLDRWLLGRRTAAFESVLGAADPGAVGLTDGDATARVVSDAQISRGMYETLVFQLPLILVTLVSTLIAMMYIDTEFACVIGVAAAIYLAVMTWATRRTVRVSSEIQRRNGHLTEYVIDTLRSARIIKTGRSQQLFVDRMRDRCTDIFSQTSRLNRLAVSTSSLPGVLQQSAVVSIVLLGAQRLATGAISAGDLVSATMYCAQVFAPITLLTQTLARFGSARASSRRVDELMELAPLGNHASADTSSLTIRRDAVREQLVHVARTMPDVQVRDQGALIVLDGPSGAGKTTAMETMLGLRDDDSCRAATYVDQAVCTPSIRIIDLLNLDRHNSRQLSAAELLQRDEWRRLDLDHLAARELLDARIGTDFIPSGGERQRLALLRAKLSDHDRVVLDEPLAHLDSANRMRAVDFINEIATEKVVVVASHVPVTTTTGAATAVSGESH